MPTYFCRRGAGDASAIADEGSFAVTDARGRTWICVERETAEPTQELIDQISRDTVRGSASWTFTCERDQLSVVLAQSPV